MEFSLDTAMQNYAPTNIYRTPWKVMSTVAKAILKAVS